ncbi:unnamed protein product [Alopecurus aequalis]
MNFPPQHYGYHPHHPQNFMSFESQGNYQQQMSGSQQSYHRLMSGMASGGHLGAPYQGSFGQYPQAFVGGGMLGGPSSSAGSGAVFGAAGGSSSRGDESGSPMSTAQYMQQGVSRDEGSDDGEEPRRQKWGKQQNLRLVGAWLKHSIDPIHGNNKKSDHYWKQVAEEFNKHSCKAERRTAVQCKNHWNRTSTRVSKFNAAVISMRRIYVSGQSEKQLIDKVQEEYKRVMDTDKPFAFDYWWIAVKDHAKWKSTYGFGEMNKRNKINSSGAYTSSNQDSSDEAEHGRPPSRTTAKTAEKEERKNKEKKTPQSSARSKLNETVVQFNDLALRKSESLEKMAADAQVHAAAISEKVKFDKMKQYLDLTAFDTTRYTPAQVARHEKALDHLSLELFGPDA